MTKFSNFYVNLVDHVVCPKELITVIILFKHTLVKGYIILPDVSTANCNPYQWHVQKQR